MKILTGKEYRELCRKATDLRLLEDGWIIGKKLLTEEEYYEYLEYKRSCEELESSQYTLTRNTKDLYDYCKTLDHGIELALDRLDDLEGDLGTLEGDLAESEYSFLQLFREQKRTLEQYGNFFEQQTIINQNIFRRLEELEDDRRTKTKTTKNVTSSTRPSKGKTTKGTSNKTTKGV